MPQFLFVFGYESPDEWRDNQTHGTDFESSDAVWIESQNEEAAMAAGRAYAERKVAELFNLHPTDDWLGWSHAGYACWLEPEPLKHWASDQLQSIPRIKA